MEHYKPLIKVKLVEHPKKVMTVLSRMGILDSEGDMNPTGYLMKLGSDWYLSHYMFVLGFFKSQFDRDLLEDDGILRLNAIARRLQKWKMLKIDEEIEEESFVKFDVMPKDSPGKINNRVHTRQLQTFNDLMEEYC